MFNDNAKIVPFLSIDRVANFNVTFDDGNVWISKEQITTLTQLSGDKVERNIARIFSKKEHDVNIASRCSAYYNTDVLASIIERSKDNMRDCDLIRSRQFLSWAKQLAKSNQNSTRPAHGFSIPIGMGAPFSNDISLHNKIGNIKIDNFQLAKSAYESACEFYESAMILMQHMKCDVSYVNMAFSCELYLKSILYYYEITPPRTHALKLLFSQLPSGIHDQILTKANLIIKYFDTVLDEINSAFEFARYLHIRINVTLNVKDLFVFTAIVYETAKQLIMPEHQN